MKSVQEVIEESDKREESLREAIAELEEIEARYVGLLELAPVFVAVKAVKAKRTTKRKVFTKQ